MNKKYINEATSIVELAEYYDLNLYNNKICCPFHDDKSPSCQLYLESNTFYCFACGAHGDILALLMKMENTGFHMAKKKLQRIFQLDSWKMEHIPVTFGRKETIIQPTSDQTNTDPSPLSRKIYAHFLGSLRLLPDGKRYLKEVRGFGDQSIKEIDMRSCSDLSPALSHLLDTFHTEDLLASGLCRMGNDKKPALFFWEPSIIIPFYNGKNEVVYFMARSIHGKVFSKLSKVPQQFYINKPEEREQYVFESVFDAIAFSEITGKKNVLSINGLSALKKLRSIFPDKNLIFCLDDDDAARESLQKLQRDGSTINIFDLRKLAKKNGVNEHVKDYNELLVEMKKSI